MDYRKMTVDELKADLIIEGKKGYPFFVAGAVYWLVMGILGFMLEDKPLALSYILGSSSIFPLAIMIGKIFKVNLLSKNPLGVLGGIIGGIQAFYLPLWIVLYVENFELIPMAVGLLGASHFLPYLWIYQSRTYMMLTIMMAAVSIIGGYVFLDDAFVSVPFSMAVVYAVTVLLLRRETSVFMSTHGKTSRTNAE